MIANDHIFCKAIEKILYTCMSVKHYLKGEYEGYK